MEIPTLNTPVTKCLALATFAGQMLSKYAATNAVLLELATKMFGARDKLATAEQAHEAAEANVLPMRVNVRFADHESDECIKQRKRTAQLADGETEGPYVLHLFPNGTTPLTRPVGAAQIKEMRALEGRYDALLDRWPDAMAEKNIVTTLRQRYEQSLAERAAAEQTVIDTKAARDLAKEDFLDVYAEIANRIRSLFPRNRPKQDLFFDAVTNRARSENDTNEAVA